MSETPLARARRRDADRRRQRVHQALADMRTDGSDITVSAVAARARVHRSFIHRHPDLHAAVLKAAAERVTDPSPSATVISHKSALAENANLHEQNRRLARQVSDLEHRLSELLGQQAFDRTGLGAPTSTAALQAELEAERQAVADLHRALDERDEELAAARETNRRLMNQINRQSLVVLRVARHERQTSLTASPACRFAWPTGVSAVLAPSRGCSPWRFNRSAAPLR